MFNDEERLEEKRALALNRPEGYEIQTLPIDELEPICKIQEPTFYKFVKDSMEAHGLYNPLVVYITTVEDWEKEMEMDHYIIPPRKEGPEKRKRVQAGCNRYFALKELGYTHCDCIVTEVLREAQDLAHVLRVDKKWQRGSNLELLKRNK